MNTPHQDLADHIDLLHRRAAPFQGRGKLVLVSFGQHPLTGVNLPPSVHHFEIGATAAMTQTATAISAQPHRNVYVPLTVLRRDLPQGQRGGLTDIVGVLGLVADFDDADAASYARRLPIPPSCVLQTSPGRFQAFYWFDNPMTPADAIPLARALRDRAACDHGTADVAHVWRVPGCPNWPNATKVAGGRSQTPAMVRAVEAFDGMLVSADAMRTQLGSSGPVGVPASIAPDDWTTEACEGWSGPTDDDELIRQALASRPSASAAFGDGVTFRQLWEADANALGRRWPETGVHGRAFDHSSADLSLATRLAWWTGRNCERIERLMRRSELAREKWDRADYMRGTILRACAHCTGGRTSLGDKAPAGEPTPEVAQRGGQLLTPLSMSTYGNREHVQTLTTSPVKLLRADEIEAEPIHWLWEGYLARGKLHLLAGPAGTGKTTIAVAMAATVTQGGRWPDKTPAPHGAVLMWSGEDGLADSLKPRFLANSGDSTGMYFVDSVLDGERGRPFDPATDMEKLQDAARQIPNLRLLIVDPVVSAVQGDSHKNAEVRRGLQPLVDLAKELDCAVLGITHFTKGTQGRDPTERVTGSLAFGALPRAVLCTAKPTDNGGQRRLIRAKSNIGPDGGGFDYDLIQVEVDHGPPPIMGQRVIWGDAITGTARELLLQVENEPGERDSHSPALGDAVTFLRDLLTAGPLAPKEVQKEARDAGHAAATLRRAKTQLGVVSEKSSMEGGWIWKLPVVAVTEGDHQDPKVLMLNGMEMPEMSEHVRTEGSIAKAGQQ